MRIDEIERNIRDAATRGEKRALVLAFKIGAMLAEARELLPEDAKFTEFIYGFRELVTKSTAYRYMRIHKRWHELKIELTDVTEPFVSIVALDKLTTDKKVPPQVMSEAVATAYKFWCDGTPLTEAVAKSCIKVAIGNHERSSSDGDDASDGKPTDDPPGESEPAEGQPEAPSEPAKTDDDKAASDAEITIGEQSPAEQTEAADAEDNAEAIHQLMLQYFATADQCGKREVLTAFTELIDEEDKAILSSLLPHSTTAKKPTKQTKQAANEAEQLDRIACPSVRNHVQSWLEYKQERNQPYKPVGLKTLITHTINLVGKHGEERVVEAINRAIANRWQGFDQSGWGDDKEPENVAEKWVEDMTAFTKGGDA